MFRELMYREQPCRKKRQTIVEEQVYGSIYTRTLFKVTTPLPRDPGRGQSYKGEIVKNCEGTSAWEHFVREHSRLVKRNKPLPRGTIVQGTSGKGTNVQTPMMAIWRENGD
jgi:hypothetical protein